MFGELIKSVFKKCGRREKEAVLIDDYDAPAVHLFDDTEKAESVRKSLEHFCETAKSRTHELGRIFIAGARRLLPGSIFSSLDLIHRTLSCGFANICGFTEEDLDNLLLLDSDRALASSLKKGSCPKAPCGRT